MKKFLGLIIIGFLWVNLGAMCDSKFVELYCSLGSDKPESLDELTELLRTELNPNCSDERGNTLLHWAINLRCFDKARVLIKYGAGANVCNYAGDTPVHWAVKNLDYEAVRFLKDECWDIKANLKNNAGKAPLHLVSERLVVEERVNRYGLERDHINCFINIALALIEAGADITSKDNNGNTVLHYAVKSKFAQFTRAVIFAGISSKFTCASNNMYMFSVLWDYVNLKNQDDKSVLDICVENGCLCHIPVEIYIIFSNEFSSEISVRIGQYVNVASEEAFKRVRARDKLRREEYKHRQALVGPIGESL